VQPVSDELKTRLVEYIVRNGADLSFTRYFWRECESLPIDVSQYSKFVEVVQMYESGVLRSDINLRTGVRPSTIYAWTRVTGVPKLVHFLASLLLLGKPSEERLWLTLEHTHGHAIPIGRFIQVPARVNSWPEVENVIRQTIASIPSIQGFDSRYLFGFLLGMIIGDAAKSKQGRGHRHIGLVLSKKYDTNLRLGDFTCKCAQYFGLRMTRKKDQVKREGKPNGFYEWTSQSSPLIDWIFHVALGLEEGELTTYDPVLLDWAIDSPLEFRTGLIQGIAESDGSVSIASQTVEFWIIPNWDFLIRLLASLGLHGFRNLEAVSLSKSQAIASFNVPVFSEYLQTVRYQKLKTMATTRRLTKEERLPVEVRQTVMGLAAHGYSIPAIVETIASSKGLLISFEAAQRWARKATHRGKSVSLGRSEDEDGDEKY
jgi:hypothetical protein